MKTEQKSRISLIVAMCIYGTIGLLRKYIDLPSSMIALARAVIGTVFLFLFLTVQKKKPDYSSIRKHLIPLLLSGAFLGFNWILLFEAYCYTTVATATLCYYMAPILIILVSAVLYREKITPKKGLCILAAVIGIVLVSGVLDTGIASISEAKGVMLGLAAAVLYASVVLLNRFIHGINALDKTLFQLAIAGIVLIPYTLMTENWGTLSIDTTGIILLLIAGVVHTGIAYALYFGSVVSLPAQTVALYSYLDPILAIVLSAVFLSEPMSVGVIIGSVFILGAALVSDRN